MSYPQIKSELKAELLSALPYFYRTLLFSLFTNILVLAPTLYMLEVYDRVVNSQSYKTLFMLTLLVIGAYILLETLEWVRSRVQQEAGLRFDERLRTRVFDLVFAARLQNMPEGRAALALGDLKTLREFISSHVMLSFIDAPFALLILIILFLIDPSIGWFSVGGAIVQFLIGFINERKIGGPLTAASQSALSAQAYASGALRNTQIVEAMGMLGPIRERWLERQRRFLQEQAIASDSAGSNAALSRLVQSLLGSLLLGLGCYLVMQGKINMTEELVGWVLGGKVLNPLVQIIAGWRQVESVRESYRRLNGMMQAMPKKEKGMPLPAPTGMLSVEGVSAGPPGTQLQVLRGLAFRIASGDCVAVVGPSASGKTTLARLLVGIWPAMSGKVRLDGSDIYAWDKEELGPHIGYLPQTVELFEGTLAENIARFGEPDPEKVRGACRMVGLEGFADTLPQGFDTNIGDDGAFLSGGQRQRVALARAVYGMPKLVVLDEPNSNLDDAGDADLVSTLQQLKALGSTVIVISHKMNILAAVGYMLVLVDGQVKLFGPRDEVLQALQPKPNTAAPQAGSAQPQAAPGGTPL
ncbi:MAG: type I secretion system permease/ATPase [Chlorobiaceae bacterium]|nr:type I secretion system permease/ATPase [Chlorobiaceae bacterium]